LSSIEELRDELKAQKEELKAQEDESKAQIDGYEERLAVMTNQLNTLQPIREVAVAIRWRLYDDFARRSRLQCVRIRRIRGSGNVARDRVMISQGDRNALRS